MTNEPVHLPTDPRLHVIEKLRTDVAQYEAAHDALRATAMHDPDSWLEAERDMEAIAWRMAEYADDLLVLLDVLAAQAVGR